MSGNSSAILGAAAEAAAAWNDETRIAFDKRFVENIARKLEAHEQALADVVKVVEDLIHVINSSSDS